MEHAEGPLDPEEQERDVLSGETDTEVGAVGDLTLEREHDPFRAFMKKIQDLLDWPLDDNLVQAFQMAKAAIHEERFDDNPAYALEIRNVFKDIRETIAQRPDLKSICAMDGPWETSVPEAPSPAPRTYPEPRALMPASVPNFSSF